jgi:hypothetical protein
MALNTYTYFLDSKYRTVDTNGLPKSPAFHPEFELDPSIHLKDANNYFEMEVMTADIPFTFHTLDIPNNTIDMTVIVPADSINTVVTLTIPAGNYSILTINDSLVTQYSNALIALGYSNPNQRPKLEITYDRATSKDTFQLVDGPNQNWTIIFSWSQSDILAEYFGFDSTVSTTLYYYIGHTSSSINGTSLYVVNVSPISSLYLRSNVLSQTIQNQEFLVESVVTTSSILAQVPIPFSYMTWIFYSTNGFKVKLQNKEIKEFDLYFSGLTYDEVRFRGAHWKMQLRITEVRPEMFVELDKSMAAQMRDAQLQIRDMESKKRELVEKTESRLGKIRQRIQAKTVD